MYGKPILVHKNLGSQQKVVYKVQAKAKANSEENRKIQAIYIQLNLKELTASNELERSVHSQH